MERSLSSKIAKECDRDVMELALSPARVLGGASAVRYFSRKRMIN